MQKKKKRNRKTLIISLAAILAAILTTVATIIYRYRDEHKVVVIFSYDQHHYGYPAFIEELEIRSAATDSTSTSTTIISTHWPTTIRPNST